MSLIEPYALFTRDAIIQVFPASVASATDDADATSEDIDLERVVWDSEYRNEIKRRLGTSPTLTR